MIRTAMTAAALSLAVSGAALANPTGQDPARVPPGTYVLDPRHTSVLAKIPHMGGFSNYTMRLNKVAGGFTYDPATWQTTQATITIDPSSVDTGDPKFDKQIAGYLGAPKYPVITFVTRTVEELAPGKGKVTGDLTLNGVTKPVILDVTFNGSGPGLLGAGTRVGFSGAGRFKRVDFGVTQASQWAGDDVDVVFEVEFVKK
jgi:polyisoprenoid-binding protein YceI